MAYFRTLYQYNELELTKITKMRKIAKNEYFICF